MNNLKELEKSTPASNKLTKLERAYMMLKLAANKRVYIYAGGKFLNALDRPPTHYNPRFVLKPKIKTMTHEEFYDAANEMVKSLNCYFVSAEIDIKRYSNSASPSKQYSICYQFGDSNSEGNYVVMTMGGTCAQTAEAAILYAHEWLNENQKYHIIKNTSV